MIKILALVDVLELMKERRRWDLTKYIKLCKNPGCRIIFCNIHLKQECCSKKCARIFARGKGMYCSQDLKELMQIAS